MIQIENLSIAFQGHFLFRNMTLSLGAKERCGFVGRNGSGKTTLFRLLLKKEQPDTGTISFQKGYRIGCLDQHIHFTQPSLLEEAALGLPKGEEDHLYKAEKILFGLGFLEKDLHLSPQHFSGGYQLRLHLAKVLISEPDCLLLDEPTNYLDIISIQWFTKFLQQWKSEFILISHDRDFMDSVTTHTMGIHRESIRKQKGGTVPFFEKIFQEEEIHEKTVANLEKKRAHLQSFIDRFGAKATKATQAQSRKKELGRIPVLEHLKKLYHLDFNFNEAPFPGKKMLEAYQLNFAYPNASQPLIKNLSLTIEKGERIAIIGKNGRGKSTLLKLLAEELVPISGNLKASENLSIGYFGQTNINRLHPKATIEEEIASANFKLNLTEIRSICGAMMFSGDLATKQTGILSGGEKSRVLLGKILATPCNLLLLDEPTHHLDIESIEALMDALEEFNGSIVLVTHSELILQRFHATQIIVCHDDRQKLFLGNYQDFLEKGGWEEKPTKSPSKKETKEIESSTKPKNVSERVIEMTEQKIVDQEKKLHHLHEALEQATHANDLEKIQQIAKDIVEQEHALEELYKTLYQM